MKKGTETEQGAQIDLLLDRKDQVINLFEIKFYQKEYVMTKADAQRLKDKQDIFQETTRTNKLILWTFIAPFGLKQNQHSLNVIYNVLTLDALFELELELEGFGFQVVVRNSCFWFFDNFCKQE